MTTEEEILVTLKVIVVILITFGSALLLAVVSVPLDPKFGIVSAAVGLLLGAISTRIVFPKKSTLSEE